MTRPGRARLADAPADSARGPRGHFPGVTARPRLVVDNTRAAAVTGGAGGRARVTLQDDSDDRRLRALMTGYQDGDREAFEQLHALLAPMLRRQLLRLARDASRADDLLQDTFLQIHRARHTYDPAYPVAPWAFAVARHVFLMDCRYRVRRGDLSRQEELDDRTPASGSAHDEALIARDSVTRALAGLSPATRNSVLLHHLHGLSFKEISRRLHVRGPALRARASRGLARLREVLDGSEDTHERK
jgi:RNA polymerase sigma-70 factor, ECF subfamily